MKTDKEAGKVAAYKTAVQEIKKNYGSEAIVSMDDEATRKMEVEFVSTGCLSLDRVLGGGLPRGRVIEIFGQPSSGKSVLSIYLMAQLQKLGEKAVLVDAECAFSPAFAEKIGLKVKDMDISQPTTAEEGLEIVRLLAASSAVGIVVVDSVASLVPSAELEGRVEDMQMAPMARLMSKALRMLTGSISKSRTIVIFINQVRDKISTFPSYGPKTTSTGGIALKFYSSVRLEVRKGKNITLNDEVKGEVIGNVISVTAVKNKTSIPFRACEVELLYEKGVDMVADLVDSGVKAGVISREGNTYSFEDIKLGVGREVAKKFLGNSDNKEIYNKIFKQINNSYATK